MIKENLQKRQNKYQDELDKISQRLSNKGFVDRAPKNIVDQEKTNYSNLKENIKKNIFNYKEFIMRKFNKKKLPSRHTSLGPDRAPQRSFYYAMGLTEKDVCKTICWSCFNLE